MFNAYELANWFDDIIHFWNKFTLFCGITKMFQPIPNTIGTWLMSNLNDVVLTCATQLNNWLLLTLSMQYRCDVYQAMSHSMNATDTSTVKWWYCDLSFTVVVFLSCPLIVFAQQIVWFLIGEIDYRQQMDEIRCNEKYQHYFLSLCNLTLFWNIYLHYSAQFRVF